MQATSLKIAAKFMNDTFNHVSENLAKLHYQKKVSEARAI